MAKHKHIVTQVAINGFHRLSALTLVACAIAFGGGAREQLAKTIDRNGFINEFGFQAAVMVIHRNLN